jgi:hypothetical protein
VICLNQPLCTDQTVNNLPLSLFPPLSIDEDVSPNCRCI